MSWISDIIVGRGGAVPFSDFMELALYHPDHGYYSQAAVRYGRSGDFLTAPTASPWYGKVVARVLERLAVHCGPLIFVDLAAGDGSFLEAVLAALGNGFRGVVERVIAVDQSAAMRLLSQPRLELWSVEHAARLADVSRPRGTVVLHASELYDALPVARVIGAGGGLVELWVAADGNQTSWRRRPAREHVEAYFKRHCVDLVDGQVAEAALASNAVHRSHLEWAGTEGLALVLDYGYDAARLYDARGRGQGSLACYHRHEVSRDPLARPGEQDLTAHVNWDDLRDAAVGLGWSECALWPLAEFLVRAGLAEVAETHGVGMEAGLDAAIFGARQEIKRLLDPEGMGSDLKVLVEGRGRIAGVASQLFGV